MQIKLSELRHRIKILRPQKHTDGEGNIITDSCPDFVTVWAKILPLTGKKSEGYEEKIQAVFYKIFIRYRDDIQISDFVLWNEKKLEQISPPCPFDGRKNFLVLEARELVENE